MAEGIIIITLTLSSIIIIFIAMYILIIEEKTKGYSYKHKIFYDCKLEKYENVVKYQKRLIYKLRIKLIITNFLLFVLRKKGDK